MFQKQKIKLFVVVDVGNKQSKFDQTSSIKIGPRNKTLIKFIFALGINSSISSLYGVKPA